MGYAENQVIYGIIHQLFLPEGLSFFTFIFPDNDLFGVSVQASQGGRHIVMLLHIALGSSAVVKDVCD